MELDMSTYMTSMQACYTDGNFDACLGLYHEMEQKRLETLRHACSFVIGGLCKDGKCAEGYAVLKKKKSMIQKGYNVNEAIYMALIDSYEKIGSMEEVRVYGIIVNGLCKSD